MNNTELKKLLDYNPFSGLFFWNISKKGITKGNKAGGYHRNGYITICINNRKYLAHRLAWLYVYEEWPENQIDHINGIKNDNRICNLREATHSENQWNQSLRDDNTSGYKGVSFHKSRNKWMARCRYKGKQFYLGVFDTPEEAAKIATEFREQHHKEFVNNG